MGKTKYLLSSVIVLLFFALLVFSVQAADGDPILSVNPGKSYTVENLTAAAVTLNTAGKDTKFDAAAYESDGSAYQVCRSKTSVDIPAGGVCVITADKDNAAALTISVPKDSVRTKKTRKPALTYVSFRGGETYEFCNVTKGDRILLPASRDNLL